MNRFSEQTRGLRELRRVVLKRRLLELARNLGQVAPVPITGPRGDYDFVKRAFPKQAMEMTEYGKHGKPRSRLSTLPTLLGNPFGITTFSRPRLLACFKIQEHEKPNPRPFSPQGGCNGGPWSKV